MIRIVLVAVCLCSMANRLQAGLVVLVAPDLTTYLYNPESKPLPFDGYHLQSVVGNLQPQGWKSISDTSLDLKSDAVPDALGPGALTFGETKPTDKSLAELNLGSFGVLQPGARFHIGKPFSGPFELLASNVGTALGVPDNPQFATLSYHMPGAVPSLPGDIVAVPEPSTTLLATLAGLGLVAMRPRGLRSGIRRSQ